MFHNPAFLIIYNRFVFQRNLCKKVNNDVVDEKNEKRRPRGRPPKNSQKTEGKPGKDEQLAEDGEQGKNGPKETPQKKMRLMKGEAATPEVTMALPPRTSARRSGKPRLSYKAMASGKLVFDSEEEEEETVQVVKVKQEVIDVSYNSDPHSQTVKKVNRNGKECLGGSEVNQRYKGSKTAKCDEGETPTKYNSPTKGRKTLKSVVVTEVKSARSTAASSKPQKDSVLKRKKPRVTSSLPTSSKAETISTRPKITAKWPTIEASGEVSMGSILQALKDSLKNRPPGKMKQAPQKMQKRDGIEPEVCMWESLGILIWQYM